MAPLSDKLRSVKDGYGAKAIAHWCPGCKEVHVIYYEAGRRPKVVWQYDLNHDAPTVSPSMRLEYHTGKVCHYFLRAGMIEYCSDNTHHLSGQKVVLPPWPYGEGEYGGLEE